MCSAPALKGPRHRPATQGTPGLSQNGRRIPPEDLESSTSADKIRSRVGHRFAPERLRGACGTRANAPVSLPSQSVCPPGEWCALAERRCHFVPERLRGACGTRADAPVSLPSQSACPPGEWRALAERRCHFAPEQVRGVCGTRADGACRSSLSVHMPARWAAYKENRGARGPHPINKPLFQRQFHAIWKPHEAEVLITPAEPTVLFVKTAQPKERPLPRQGALLLSFILIPV